MLVFVSTGVKADWVEISQGEGGFVIWYADPATIRKSSVGVKVWHLRNYKKMQKDKDVAPFSSTKAQVECDCQEERIRILFFSNYTGLMSSGKTNYSSAAVGDWVPVAPGSLNESLWDYACGKQ